MLLILLFIIVILLFVLPKEAKVTEERPLEICFCWNKIVSSFLANSIFRIISSFHRMNMILFSIRRYFVSGSVYPSMGGWNPFTKIVFLLYSEIKTIYTFRLVYNCRSIGYCLVFVSASGSAYPSMGGWNPFTKIVFCPHFNFYEMHYIFLSSRKIDLLIR